MSEKKDMSEKDVVKIVEICIVNPQKKIVHVNTMHTIQMVRIGLKKKTIMMKELMDPVDKKELKGKHKDRKDKDIDNDGDVDSGDKYLHKRRKAVSKSIKKDKKRR